MIPEDLNQAPTEDEIAMMLIEFHIYKAKQNQKEFIKAIDEFFDSV